MQISKFWLRHTKQGREIVDENDSLKAMLGNRDLYLSYVQEKAPELFAEMKNHFVCLPGCAAAK